VIKDLKSDIYNNTYSRHPNNDIDEYLTNIIGNKYSEYRIKWKEVHELKSQSDFPLYIAIETQRSCTLKCSFCSFRNGAKNTLGYYSEVMSEQLFDKILIEVKENYCPSMGFNVLNEPLLDKRIYKFIKKSHDAGIIDSRINTNGIALNNENIKKILDSGLVKINISIDAFEKDTYESNRIGSNYSKLMKNIESFLNIREKKNLKLPILIVSFIKMKANIAELDDFFNFWRDRADLINFQNFHSPFIFKPEDNKASRVNIGDSFSCPQPNERFIVMGNGDVAPCCSQSNSYLIMGNIKENSIKDIWESKKYKDLKTMMFEKSWQSSRICKTCIEQSILN
jgi:radical SAM protein with 4Fe4S-binding SPASM domain